MDKNDLHSLTSSKVDKKDLFKSILLSDLDDNITIYKNLGYHISSLKKDTIIKDEVFINILEELIFNQSVNCAFDRL